MNWMSLISFSCIISSLICLADSQPTMAIRKPIRHSSRRAVDRVKIWLIFCARNRYTRSYVPWVFVRISHVVWQKLWFRQRNKKRRPKSTHTSHTWASTSRNGEQRTERGLPLWLSLSLVHFLSATTRWMAFCAHRLHRIYMEMRLFLPI